MFQAWPVKMAKMDAASSPNRLPRNSAMNAVTVTDKKPSTGIDCRISNSGTSTRSARLLRAGKEAGIFECDAGVPSDGSQQLLIVHGRRRPSIGKAEHAQQFAG